MPLQEMIMKSPYLRLMRLHQPVGIWLLFWPSSWAVAMAAPDISTMLHFLGLFLIGAVAMRSAGCIVNDMLDRKFDAQVERTRNRPLASGELSVKQALLPLLLMLLVALAIALQLNRAALLLAMASLVLVGVYPLMKRVIWWPQAFLGLTFNWGALLGWAAVTGMVELPALLLYAAGFFWTLGYDTIYAHQDTKDDVKAGVKSTALRLGAHSKRWILLFYMASTLCLLLAGYSMHMHPVYYIGVGVWCAYLLVQLTRVRLDVPESCLKAFKSNAVDGVIPFVTILYILMFH